eukprot:Gregarina_sp_Poly_1__1791@NODE_1464_length_4069_cov_21_328836_g968_i0_p1_GENE_NODE_1464_length_4069_cov_21_328836_g968_i0NODE_1464_length_4069_cov_21_328836_g968_i0_p1_ORF_typecomplete_len1207_score221_11Utp21/PF04192_12/2_8e28ANAPC4_WD40/PF12894_7/0_12ANAPC4_WD40/PF12894_7/7_5e02ANAPC4_WD40/PF12894_7/0_013ANAPC4_WD40/PF12894_7/2_2e02ANAPC4_WD40/PF12894_7/61ANAPC4_WD40/PF12894_7/1_8e03Cytochrom_D1/PF02239_16/71Cytochrom_D1/PF02239_16/66Cytochrom_D1/PF02239_16/2_9e03Cytochrom_D1/PF02239_16/0_21Ut
MSGGLFDPLRTLGLVCNPTPCRTFESGLQRFILASTGFGYQIIDADKLRPAFISINMGDLITAMDCAGVAEKVYVSLLSKRKLRCYHRHDLIWETETRLESILGLRLFGSLLVVWSRHRMEIRDAADGSLFGPVDLGSLTPLGGLCCHSLCHIPGRTNELFLGGSAGQLGTLSTVSLETVATYRGVRKALAQHLSGVNETLLTPSHIEDWAVDVVLSGGLGNEKGVFVSLSTTKSYHQNEVAPLICGLDLACDEVVFTFIMTKDQRKVLSLALKDRLQNPTFAQAPPGTDFDQDVLGKELLYAGCQNGDLVIFDLEQGKLAHVVSRVHVGVSDDSIPELVEDASPSVKVALDNDVSTDDDDDETDSSSVSQHLEADMFATGSSCSEASYRGGVRTVSALGLGGEEGALILTSGADNAIIIWHFLNLSQKPQLLKARRGLPGEISFLEFYDKDDESKELLVASNEWKVAKNSNNKLSHDKPACQFFSRHLGRNRGLGHVGKVSYVRSQQDCVYPQEKALRKLKDVWRNKLRFLPAVSGVSFSRDRHFDWPAVVTTHQGMHQAMVWSVLNKTLVPVVLELPFKGSGSSPLKQTLTSLSLALADIGRLSKTLTSGDLKKSPALGVSVSECGHFVVIGYQDGSVHHFNLQSRRHVGTFMRRTEEASDLQQTSDLGKLAVETLHETNPVKMTKKRKALAYKLETARGQKREFQVCNAHSGSVRHVKILHSSRVYTASSTPADLRIHLWELLSKDLVSTIDVEEILKASDSTSFLSCCPVIHHFLVEGNMLMVGLETTTLETETESETSLVLLLDPSGRVLRRFGPLVNSAVGHMELSPDGEWLLMSCWRRDVADGRLTSDLKVFDLQSTQLIEWVRFPAPLTAFTMHPSSAFLVTAHVAPPRPTFALDVPISVSDLGDETARQLFPAGALHVWANLAVFGGLSDAVRRTAGVSAPRLIDFPPLQIERDAEVADPPNVQADQEEKLLQSLPPVTEEKDNLSLSSWSPQRIDMLLNWDKIKLANQPTKPPEKPEAEPFFLYSAAEFEDAKEWSEKNKEQNEELEDDSELKDDSVERNMRASLAEVSRRQTAAYELLDEMESFRIPRIHRCLHCLGDVGGGSLSTVVLMLNCFVLWVKHKRKIDLVQALLKLFFAIHGQDLIAVATDGDSGARDRVVRHLKEISLHCKQQWSLLGNQFDALICYVKYSTLLQLD